MRGLLECVLCRGRFAPEDTTAGLYFLESMVCASCYGGLQRQPQIVCCFGKPSVIRPGQQRQLGYSAKALECQFYCTDRVACACVMGRGPKRRLSLEHYAMQWGNVVARTLAIIEGVALDDVHLGLRGRKLIRLLNLKVWGLRYHIELGFVLRTLLTYYQAHRARIRKVVRLGISVGALCGRASRRVLEEAINRAFPNGENIELWRSERMRQLLELAPGVRVSYTDSLDGMVSSYQKAVLKRRRVLSRAERAFPRPWRENPWR